MTCGPVLPSRNGRLSASARCYVGIALAWSSCSPDLRPENPPHRLSAVTDDPAQRRYCASFGTPLATAHSTHSQSSVTQGFVIVNVVPKESTLHPGSMCTPFLCKNILQVAFHIDIYLWQRILWYSNRADFKGAVLSVDFEPYNQVISFKGLIYAHKNFQ